MRHVTFVIMEPGCDRVAIVTADIGDIVGEHPEREDELESEAGFMAAIRRGVLRWVHTSNRGTHAFKETHGQLTIETLVPYIDLSLRMILASEGIVCLSILLVEASESGDWHLTDLLYEKEERHE